MVNLQYTKLDKIRQHTAYNSYGVSFEKLCSVKNYLEKTTQTVYSVGRQTALPTEYYKKFLLFLRWFGKTGFVRTGTVFAKNLSIIQNTTKIKNKLFLAKYFRIIAVERRARSKKKQRSIAQNRASRTATYSVYRRYRTVIVDATFKKELKKQTKHFFKKTSVVRVNSFWKKQCAVSKQQLVSVFKNSFVTVDKLIAQKYYFYNMASATLFKHRVGDLHKMQQLTVMPAFKEDYYLGVHQAIAPKIAFYRNFYKALHEKNGTHYGDDEAPEEKILEKNIARHVDLDRVFGSGVSAATPDRFFQIRFKPGYLPLFRRLRASFYITRNLSLYRHERLTKYIATYNRLSLSAKIRFETFSLAHVLCVIKFALTKKTAQHLAETGVIFLNYICCTKVCLQVQRFDVIQLSVSYAMYNNVRSNIAAIVRIAETFYNYSMLYYAKRQAALGNTDYNSVREFKNFSYTVRVKRLINISMFLCDVPSFAEVDYLTLSTLIIRDLRYVNDIDPLLVRRSFSAISRMLNWKYVN